MDRKVVMAGAGALALVGVAAGAWSVAKNTGGASSREFGRVGMSVAPEARQTSGPGGAFEPGDIGEGENVLRMSPDDLPEGFAAFSHDDGMDRSSFNFPTIRNERDAQAMLDDLRSAAAAKASGAAAYRQAPPIGKQRFADAAVGFVEPFIIESKRPELDGDARPSSRQMFGSDRGLDGPYYGTATQLASLDVAQLRVGDAVERPTFRLPAEAMEGLDIGERAGDGEGQPRVEMNFVTSGGGWSRHEVTHPMSEGGIERPESLPVAQLTLPLKSDRLGSDVLDARIEITMWWDEQAQQWRPGNTTLRYLTEGSEQEDRPNQRRMEFRQ